MFLLNLLYFYILYFTSYFHEYHGFPMGLPWSSAAAAAAAFCFLRRRGAVDSAAAVSERARRPRRSQRESCGRTLKIRVARRDGYVKWTWLCEYVDDMSELIWNIYIYMYNIYIYILYVYIYIILYYIYIILYILNIYILLYIYIWYMPNFFVYLGSSHDNGMWDWPFFGMWRIFWDPPIGSLQSLQYMYLDMIVWIYWDSVSQNMFHWSNSTMIPI